MDPEKCQNLVLVSKSPQRCANVIHTIKHIYPSTCVPRSVFWWRSERIHVLVLLVVQSKVVHVIGSETDQEIIVISGLARVWLVRHLIGNYATEKGRERSRA